MGRIATPLSDRKIKLAKPREKIYRLSDGNGLVLEIKPNGSKVWRVRYTLNKKAKTYTIGDYPTISLAEARAITIDVKNLVTKGIDPVRHRQEQERKKQVESKKNFKNIAQEYFELKKGELAPNYYEKLLRRAEIYIYPFIGFKNIDNITKSDIVEIIKKVKDIHTPSTRTTNKVETARRIHSLLRQIWQFALHNDYTTQDVPSRIDITKILPKHNPSRIKAVTSEEIKNIYQAIIHDFKGYTIIQDALQFLALTALRPGNVRNLKWEYIDFDKALILFPPEAMKTKEQFRLPLTPTLQNLLESLHRNRNHTSPYVFHSPIQTFNMLSENTLNVAHKRLGIHDHNAHGWRSSFSTICYEHQREHGFGAEVIEAQLAHKFGNNVTRAYMRSDFLEERRGLLEWWEGYLNG